MSQTEKIFDRLPDTWQNDLLEMYDNGASDREVMRAFELSHGAWKSLCDDTMLSNFGELVDYGRMLSRAWWELQGRKNLFTKSFNTALWSLNMKNRFGWSEKSEQSVTNVDVIKNMDDVTLEREVRELVGQFGRAAKG